MTWCVYLEASGMSSAETDRNSLRRDRSKLLIGRTRDVTIRVLAGMAGAVDEECMKITPPSQLPLTVIPIR